MTTTGSTFDLSSLARSIEARDAAGQLAHYADDAVIEIVDRDHPPSTPERVSGADAIQAYLDDVAGRDMTHAVRHALSDGEEASLWVDCEYPDGTRVRCAGAIELRDGKIVRQDVVQEWDA
jgi:ketosteroid isomerase-like protein